MYDMKKKYTVLILISFAMGVIFSLMLMLPLAEKKLQKSISDDRNNTITEMNELSDILRLYNIFLKNESAHHLLSPMFKTEVLSARH